MKHLTFREIQIYDSQMDCYFEKSCTIFHCLVSDVQPKSHPKSRGLQFKMGFSQGSTISVFLTISTILTRFASQQVRTHYSSFD